MPSKPSPKRRPRVAGTRPGSAPSPTEGADSASPDDTATPPETGEVAEAPETSGDEHDTAAPETPSETAQESSPQDAGDEQALPDEIASAARIERGEPEPEHGAADRPTPRSRHGASTEEQAADAESGFGDDPVRGDESADGDSDSGAAEQGSSAAPPVKLAVVLTVVALLLGGFAAVAALRWGSAAQTSGNRALTDAAATRQVTTQVSGALNTLLAFDYKHPDKHDQAAKRLIDGKLADCTGPSSNVGYKQLMGVLREKGPKAQLTLKSTVISSGVQQLRGDRAQLLVLLNQQYSKGEGKKAQKSSALAAAVVHTVHKGGRWQLTALCLQ